MREKTADYLITAGKQQFKVKVSEKRERIVSDSKLEPIENKVNPDQNESMDDTRASLEDKNVRFGKSKARSRNRTRRPGRRNVRNQVSTKENGPSHRPQEAASQVDVPVGQVDVGALLESIKDIVSTHTKKESSTIQSKIQSLYCRSRANMVRHMSEMTDELADEISSLKDSDSRMERLMAQNNELKEEILYYYRQTDELRSQVKELELLKQENLTLKMNCKELLELQKKVEELELEKQENLTRKQNPKESLKE